MKRDLAKYSGYAACAISGFFIAVDVVPKVLVLALLVVGIVLLALAKTARVGDR